jgi:hypothetical protein
MSSTQLVINILISISTLVGLSISVLLPHYVSNWLINLATSDINKKPPNGIKEEKWKLIKEPAKRGGQVLGALETILFFISFWITHPELIIGLLVFKVGTKWEI